MRGESFRNTIRDRYGSRYLKLADNLQKSTTKLTRQTNHLKFLKRCRKDDIIPRSLRVYLHGSDLKNKSVVRLKSKLESARVRSRIMDVRRKIYQGKHQIDGVSTTLRETLGNTDFQWLKKVIDTSRLKEDEMVKRRQKRKFEILQEEKDKTEERYKKERDECQKMKKDKIKVEVVDLTKQGIDDEIKSYLSLGPDFCEAPTRVPYEKIIAETEKMCSVIKEEGKKKKVSEIEVDKEIDELREEVKEVLRKTKNRNYNTNLTKEEMRGKKKAMKDKEKVFLPADKGRIMVAMDRYESIGGEESYECKMKQVLVDLKARPSLRAGEDWDLTDKVCRDGAKVIDRIVHRKELTEDQGNRLKPKNCHAPRLTGLPKVHKEGVPMRGIVSMIGSPFEKISKTLIPILRTIQGRSGLFGKNSRELKEKIKSWRVDRNEILVSYDVKNLYPSIPIDKALELVETLLSKNENLGETTTMSVTSTI